TSWWVDGVEPIESAFFSDLLPDVRKKYSVSDEREARVVAGFSMGGYGAMRFALAHPERFGGAILLSPALYEHLPPIESSARSSGAFGTPFDPRLWTSRNYLALLPAYLAGQNSVQLFIGAGDDDWNHPGAHDMNIEIQATVFYNTLNKKHGSPAELRIADGSHDWALWLPLFEEAMKVMARELQPFRGSRTGC
ncbi:MAG: alpha/beta hydrolase, partial [Woeseiaceae bacterium]